MAEKSEKSNEGDLLFITNRRLLLRNGTDASTADNHWPKKDASFDIKINEPTSSIHFCARQAVDSYQILGHEEFLARLRDHSARQVLLFIHGYSNLPEPDIFLRAEELQKLCDKYEQGLLIVVPLIWPCDSDEGILKDYWDDQKAADASAPGFERMLGKFVLWRDKQADVANACYKRVNILAHSMGNRVLRGALDSYSRAAMVQAIFRNIFMVAADVRNETLEPCESGRQISRAARNVVVYHANDDFALRASKVVNLKNAVVSRRLGHTGPENMSKVNKNVYAIDCDDFNNTLDSPKGHSYFIGTGQKQPVLRHMLHAMKTGRVDADAATRTKVLSVNY